MTDKNDKLKTWAALQSALQSAPCPHRMMMEIQLDLRTAEYECLKKALAPCKILAIVFVFLVSFVYSIRSFKRVLTHPN